MLRLALIRNSMAVREQLRPKFIHGANGSSQHDMEWPMFHIYLCINNLSFFLCVLLIVFIFRDEEVNDRFEHRDIRVNSNNGLKRKVCTIYSFIKREYVCSTSYILLNGRPHALIL